MPVLEITKPIEKNGDNVLDKFYPSIEITSVTENDDDNVMEKLYPAIEITPSTENNDDIGLGIINNCISYSKSICS